MNECKCDERKEIYVKKIAENELMQVLVEQHKLHITFDELKNTQTSSSLSACK